MSAGVKGTKGVVFNMTLPRAICERLDRRADKDYSTRTEWLRRFIIDNIDVIDPEGTTE